jgi:hypothetical protein
VFMGMKCPQAAEESSRAMQVNILKRKLNAITKCHNRLFRRKDA